ncbi:protein FAM166B-like [Bombina bombina]|uniref:protein FAM166B-like n=1 Tax=Bombina bombina TaxID=8345 RepID=UPI00235A8DF8|nr:protein FAM166B-like [Bombina bombina]
MPIIVPQQHESIYSTYEPHYVPGYTGYITKLRSDIGNVYGNATLKLVDYEPGAQKSLSRIIIFFCNQGHFYPVTAKYYHTQMNYIRDGDPKTSSAIQTIEEIKKETNKPTRWLPCDADRFGSLPSGLQTTNCAERCEQIASSSSSYGDKIRGIIQKKELKASESSRSINKINENELKRQGKIIYRTESGLLPNYTGYTPGQMFVIGKTWGKSTIDAKGKHQEQPFVWTSLF